MGPAEQTVRSYFENFEERNADDLAALFATDAAFMPNGVATVRGRSAIHAFFADRVFPGAQVRFDAIYVDRVYDLAGAAVVETRTLEHIDPAGDSPAQAHEFRESFTVCDDDGRWLIVSYMGNAVARQL